MEKTRKYVFITEETIKSARERMRKELNDITNGYAQLALDLAEEYRELDEIIKEEFGEQTA